MNLEKVVFSFFMILALTLNFGFFIGEVDNPAHHNVYELSPICRYIFFFFAKATGTP